MQFHRAFLFFFLITGLPVIGLSQQTIDQTVKFPPGSANSHKYSVYVPSGYDTATPSRLIIAFHPLGIGTWTSRTWRDTLISFAEANDAILFCPDGGINGRTDDVEDYAFTLAFMDSMETWYNVNEKGIFGLGFSVGGKAAYEFCLKYNYRFKGCIPIGAAVSGTSTFIDVLDRARCLNFYIIHGDKDSPNTRYYPVKSALENNGANVSSLLMAGIGHTIDFPSRNTILKNALTFVDTTSCDFTAISGSTSYGTLSVFPNPTNDGVFVLQKKDQKTDELSVTAMDVTGRAVRLTAHPQRRGIWAVDASGLPPGTFVLQVSSGRETTFFRIIIQ